MQGFTCHAGAAPSQPADGATLPRLVYAIAPAAQHDHYGHPECAARVPAILSALDKAGLTDTALPQQVTFRLNNDYATAVIDAGIAQPFALARLS